MDARTKDRLRKRLAEERERLNSELTELEREAFSESQSASSGENNYRDHMADSATETFERERDLTLSENLRRLLAEVEAAQARLDEGTYGTCGSCGHPIPKERLEAYPAAAYCVECKKQQERT